MADEVLVKVCPASRRLVAVRREAKVTAARKRTKERKRGQPIEPNLISTLGSNERKREISNIANRQLLRRPFVTPKTQIKTGVPWCRVEVLGALDDLLERCLVVAR